MINLVVVLNMFNYIWDDDRQWPDSVKSPISRPEPLAICFTSSGIIPANIQAGIPALGSNHSLWNPLKSHGLRMWPVKRTHKFPLSLCSYTN